MRLFLLGVLAGIVLSAALRPKALPPIEPEHYAPLPPYDPRQWQELWHR